MSAVPENATLARGLAVIAVFAVAAIASQSLWPKRGNGECGPEPVCLWPVEVLEGTRSRLGCSIEPILQACGQLETGDRVELESGACRRVEGGMAGAMRLVAGVPLDLNRSSAAELELLDGIGPKLAEAIVVDREENGDFETLEALDRVPGVGPAALERLRPFVMVSR